MARLFSSILFCCFLLFPTMVMTDDENASTQIAVEESQSSEGNNQTDVDTEEALEEKEVEEELSELEKEALAAEEAELREAGIEEEPVEE